MGQHKCLNCKKKASITNIKNLQCKNCNQFYHLKCVRTLPPICLQKCGSFRYKVARNPNWVCEACVLNELPFYNISNSQVKSLIPKFILPSCDVLNSQFLTENQDECENKADFQFAYTTNETKYSYSTDLKNLKFADECEPYGNFPIVSLNVRSIVNRENFSKFQAFLQNLPVKPMIIALNETWITDSSKGPYSKINGYKFIQNHREKHAGGGVAFYIANHLHFKRIESISLMKEKVFESLFVSVDIGEKQSTIFGTIYRTPDSNHAPFIENLEFVLKESTKTNRRVIIMGDQNYNLLSTKNSDVNNFVDKFFEFGMYPLINIPTRITDTTASVLDHFWTNIVDVPIKSTVVVNPISDHLPIYMTIGINDSQKELFVEKRNFSEKNIENFNNSLSKMYIFDILQHKSTNAAYNVFIKRYIEIFEKSFPKKRMKISIERKYKNPWYTKELSDLNHQKEKHYMYYIKNKNIEFFKAQYIRSRNEYFRKVKMTKKQFFQKHLLKVKNDIKGTWKVINTVLGRSKNKQLFKLSIGGKEVKNETKIANEFNKYFSNIADNLVKEIPFINSRKRFNEYLGSRNAKCIFLNPTNPVEIGKILKSMALKFSSGWDNIPQKIIKSSPFNIIHALSHIFNLSIIEGVFPDKMKVAKVIPIFKKDSKTDVANYRPISLLTVFSKILERLIYNRMNCFLKKCDILYEKQFGFRKKHSTSHATAYLSSKLYTTLDNTEKSVCIFMDLSKAFDTINIDIMLEKLNHYGVRGVAKNWFSSYLKGRKQFVLINGKKSETMCDILHGVPQGSILGPLLFSIYINDFRNCLKYSEAIMFADDTTLLFKDSNMETLNQKVNNDLASATDWLAENKLSLNVKKTKFMVFDKSRNSTNVDIRISNDKLKRVKSQKILGVIFDEKLTWKDHINSIISKLNSCLGASRRARPYLNMKSLLTIYHSLMQSHVNYCLTTWGAWEPRGNKKLLQRLQAVCNKFFRAMYYLDRDQSVRSYLKSHNVLNIFQNYDYQVGQIMHKAINGNLPNVLRNHLTVENDFFLFQKSTN